MDNISMDSIAMNACRPGYTYWQQCLYERHDALDDACLSLRLAAEALRSCGTPSDADEEYLDALETIEDIATGLMRDRDRLRRTLVQLEAQNRAALARELLDDAL